MAHTKAAGSAKRTVDVAGKRLGVKKFSGEFVKAGNIIIRQHGSHFHPGVGVMQGRDYTIFAVNEGFVSYRPMSGHKRGLKLVDVLVARDTIAPNAIKAVAKAKSATSEAKSEAKAAPAKKAAKPKKAAAKK